jgi:uncharacterized protein (DUF433 family)
MIDRITTNLEKMGGVPCIRGLRIPVSIILTLISEGLSEDNIMELYPDLEKEDFPAILRYAANIIQEEHSHFLEAV